MLSIEFLERGSRNAWLPAPAANLVAAFCGPEYVDVETIRGLVPGTRHAEALAFLRWARVCALLYGAEHVSRWHLPFSQKLPALYVCLARRYGLLPVQDVELLYANSARFGLSATGDFALDGERAMVVLSTVRNPMVPLLDDFLAKTQAKPVNVFARGDAHLWGVEFSNVIHAQLGSLARCPRAAERVFLTVVCEDGNLHPWRFVQRKYRGSFADWRFISSFDE